MKLIALVTIFPGAVAPGEEFSIKDAEGKDLIERGLAKAAPEPVKARLSKAEQAALDKAAAEQAAAEKSAAEQAEAERLAAEQAAADKAAQDADKEGASS